MQPYTLITGASAGIGHATAELFAKEKRNLILIARRKERLTELQKTLKDVDVRIHSFDLTDDRALDAFFSEIRDLPIDVLVNNAGLAVGVESFDAYDLKDIDTMLAVNIRALVRVTHKTLPFLKKTKGHIVNLGSIAGMETYKGGTIYAATKHFVHAFTRGLRQDLLGSGIRVTTIAPGRVETEFSEVRLRGDKSAAKKVYEGYTPLAPEDIAAAIFHAVTCPPHVNTELMLVMPTDQAGLRVQAS